MSGCFLGNVRAAMQLRRIPQEAAQRQRGNTMAWERRKGRGAYYTRSRKVGGRVVREYIGTGAVAALAAELDRMERERRRQREREWRETRRRLEALEAEMRALEVNSDRVVRAELAVAGYHQHARGEWRRRREGRQ